MSFRLRAAVALPLLALLAACSSDSPTGSGGGSISVQLTGTTSPPVSTSNSQGQPVLECTISLSASATGKQGTTAVLGGSKVRFFVGANRTVAADSASLSGPEMQAAWGASSIVAGQTLTAQLVLRSAVPFAYELEIEYGNPGSTARKAKWAGTCGGADANAAAPSVTNLTVTPGDGEIEPGQTLTVQYTFSAPAGVWETEILLAGGASLARVTRESFQTAETRSVTLTIPGGVILGQRAAVTVRVTDALLRSAQAGPVYSPVLVDHTPPTSFQVTTRGTFQRQAELAGVYAPGDTITLHAIAADNNQLAWMVWELGAPAGVRDSVAISSGPVVGPARIVVRPEWAGTPQLSVWVTDPSGNRSQVLSSLPDSIRITSLVTRPVRTAALPRGGAMDAMVDPAAHRLYVTADIGNRISVLSLASMTAEASIDLPSPPLSLDLTPGGDSLVAAMPLVHSIARVDLASRGVTAVPLGADSLRGPYSVRVGADGSLLGVFYRADDAGVLARIDRATGAVTPVAPAAVGGTRLERTPDHTRMYWSFGPGCVRTYVVATGVLGGCTPLMGSRRLASDRTGAVVSNGESVWSAATGRVHVFPYEMAITGATPSLDGAYLWISTVRGLVRARPDGTVLDRATGIGTMYDGMFVLDNGATLVGLNDEDGLHTMVYVVDLR